MKSEECNAILSKREFATAMNKAIIGCWLLAIGLTACSSDDAGSSQESDVPPVENRQTVDIVTRSEGDGISGSGLKAGLYMVNYADEQQMPLLASGNYVNNLLMNHSDGAWQPTTPIYWQNSNVNADFYAYAPYAAEVSDARAMMFRVATDQTSDDAYNKSDLLWGAVQGQSPLAGKFNLMLNHVLSSLTIVVAPGAGFSEGELTTNDVSVSIGGSKTLGTIDLQTGIVTATGEVADVKCRSNSDLTYSAILLPQQIAFANLVKVDWNGNSYTLQNSFKLEAKKQYRLTIKLNKTQGGLDIGISGWDIIDEDFGGTVG